MSFDLAVWHSDRPLNAQEADDIYQNLCENPAFLEGVQPSVAAFYAALTARWPEIDTIAEEKIGDFDFCPWSCALDRSGMAVLMCCVWPMADKVAEFVMELAYKHELVCYDPQASRVILPATLRPPAKPHSAKHGIFARLFGSSK